MKLTAKVNGYFIELFWNLIHVLSQLPGEELKGDIFNLIWLHISFHSLHFCFIEHTCQNLFHQINEWKISKNTKSVFWFQCVSFYSIFGHNTITLLRSSLSNLFIFFLICILLYWFVQFVFQRIFAVINFYNFIVRKLHKKSEEPASRIYSR